MSFSGEYQRDPTAALSPTRELSGFKNTVGRCPASWKPTGTFCLGPNLPMTQWHLPSPRSRTARSTPSSVAAMLLLPVTLIARSARPRLHFASGDKAQGTLGHAGAGVNQHSAATPGDYLNRLEHGPRFWAAIPSAAEPYQARRMLGNHAARSTGIPRSHAGCHENLWT